jgi:hydroxyacylglutathione hydrolase
MLKVKQFRYDSDNLAYLVHGDRTAMAIDGGAASRILEYLEQNGLKLAIVTNTHGHYDHTPGNNLLVSATGAAFIGHETLAGKSVDIDGEPVHVYRTPGHTSDSVIFYTGSALITGDTLFNGTVGNCFSGDVEGFFRSLKMILDFPSETLVYAGHDYVKASVAFTRTIDRDNPHLEDFLKKYNPYHVVSTLEDEMLVNPYMRFDDEKMTEILKERNLSVSDSFTRFRSLMEVY